MHPQNLAEEFNLESTSPRTQNCCRQMLLDPKSKPGILAKSL